MNLRLPSPRCAAWRSQHGSAVLIVLVLVASMVIVSMCNTDTLASLKKELQLIERRQAEKYEQGPAH